MRKNILHFTAFLLLFLVGLFLVSRLNLLYLRDPNNHEFNHEYFYELPENSVDVLIVGSSHSYCSFIPALLYEEYGISSYNLATSNQSMLACYLWAKEAYETQKYKVLVVEAMSVSNSHGDIENDIRSLNSMGLSPHYFELMKTYKRQSLKVLFPVISFHQSWDSITPASFRKTVYEDGAAMRGYVPLFSTAGMENTTQIVDETDPTVGYLKYPYVDKLREFCDENSIQLLFIKAPLANVEVNHWDTGMHNNLVQYTSQYNIPFWDFNAASDAQLAGIQASEDVAADGRHCNYSGAVKITRFLGKFLKEEWQISSAPGSFSEEALASYHRIIDAQK